MLFVLILGKMIKVAVATDDGKTISEKHFGSADFYLIYDMEKIKLLEKRENTSIEEKGHGNPEKARSVSNLLKDVDVLLGFAMGQNIVRIRKRFVPVISRIKDIKKALDVLKQKSDEIEAQLNEKEKKVLFLRKI